MSEKNLRIGIIGAGRIGIVHAGSVSDTAGAEIALIVDAVEESAAKLAGQYNAKYTTNVDDVFSKGDLDAIIVGSPTPTHVDLISRAVDAGIHVMCEKPVDLDINRAMTIYDKVKNAKTNVSIGFNRRFDPTFAEIHTRVAKGELGNLEQLIITSRDPGEPPRAYIGVSGGIFRDQVIHDFDMARFFVGDIEEVSAFAANAFSADIKAEGDFDTTFTTLRSTSGVLVSIIASRRAAYGYDQRLEAFGEKGMLQANNLTSTQVQSFGADHANKNNAFMGFFLERYAASYRAELRLFIESVKTGKQLNPSYEDGCKALILADAATESAKTGKIVKIKN